jgi:cyclophilin family peptidyl-prolyl cis-trans isomerase/HEAT repeat protein
MPTVHPNVRIIALVVGLSLLAGCASLKQRREDKRLIEEEAAEADATLAATTVDEALLAIARIRDARRDAMALQELALHDEPVVRVAALRALGLVGDRGSVETLIDGLYDVEPEVRAMGAFSLSQLWGWRMTELERTLTTVEVEEALISGLEEELDSDNAPTVLAALVRALGELGGEASEELLWRLVGQEELREGVYIALAMRARREATAPIAMAKLDVLAATVPEGDAPPWQLAYLMSRAGFADGVQEFAATQLMGWFQDAADEPDARAWLIRSMGKAPQPFLMDVLTGVLETGTFRDRVNAIRAASTAGEIGVPVLVAALSDAEDAIAVEAAQSLGRAPTDDAWAGLLGWSGLNPTREAGRIDGLSGFLGTPEERGAHAEEAAAIATTALESPEARVRAAGYGLLADEPGAATAELLLARLDSEQDPLARLTLASAIGERPDEIVEGTLLSWLDGDDPQLGAVAADGLKEREGDHLTVRLAEAYVATRPAEGAADTDWERRLGIVRAFAPREGVHPEQMMAMLGDPEPLVRMAAFDALVERVGRAKAESGTPLQARPYPELSDPWFGAGDVTQATITTSRGTMVLILFPEVAPGAVANFARLADDGFYDGQVFHRVVSDFVIQAGDPDGTGWGGPGYTIRDEFSPLPFRRGTLGMARSDKDTAGSQWFVTHGAHPHLEGHYTAFGQLVSGWDVLDAVRQGDVVETIRVTRKGQ